VLLRQGQNGSAVHGLREEVRDFLPHLASLARESLELFLEVFKGLGDYIGTLLGNVLRILLVRSKDLLQAWGSRRSGSHQKSGGQDSHCKLCL
jgi:hypothetical protein